MLPLLAVAVKGRLFGGLDYPNAAQGDLIPCFWRHVVIRS